MNKGKPLSFGFCGSIRHRQILLSVACTIFISAVSVPNFSFLTTSAHATTKAVPDYKVKAALLAQFLRYVKWPETDSKSEGDIVVGIIGEDPYGCLLYTSPSPRDRTRSRMPSSA